MHPGVSLTDAMDAWYLRRGLPTKLAGTGGSRTVVLNPAFVEALMDFPAGWTVLGNAVVASQAAAAFVELRSRFGA